MEGLYVVKVHLRDNYGCLQIESIYDLTLKQVLKFVAIGEYNQCEIIKFEIIKK